MSKNRAGVPNPFLAPTFKMHKNAFTSCLQLIHSKSQFLRLTETELVVLSSAKAHWWKFSSQIHGDRPMIYILEGHFDMKGPYGV